MRTIVDLTPSQIARLDQVASREHISRAEAMRRAVEIVYAEEDPAKTVQAIRRRTFGAWHKLGIDAQKYVDDIRDEWER